MADYLPLLVFPQARKIDPPDGRGFGSPPPHLPAHGRQVERLTIQFDELEQDFSKYKASISDVASGLEPETVLVIEIAGKVEDFKNAVDSSDGLEWLGEWDIDDLEPDEDFYESPKIGVDFFKNKLPGITKREQSKELREILAESGFIDQEGDKIADDLPILALPEHLSHINRNDIIRAIDDARKSKRLGGRMFLSFANEQGMKELLALWKKWESRQGLPYGKTKWRDVFTQTRKIRRWGIEETLRETGMIDRWRDLLEPIVPDQMIHFQIELFYRRNSDKRRANEVAIQSLLGELDGRILGQFIDMGKIAFHAVKAELPAEKIRYLLSAINPDNSEVDIHLFKFPNVMYFRPTGQSIAIGSKEEGDAADISEGQAELPPVVGILDGVPSIQHAALKNRLLFDDPDNLSSEYQPGERKHGTSMASLVVHGEIVDGQSTPLKRLVYHLPVMQPNSQARSFGKIDEHFPDDTFAEDRIERAVRRIFEGEGTTPAQAPTVKIINMSLGDPERPFIHTPSPWARLLDWLSFKYKVLFCVSAGNYRDGVDVEMARDEFEALSDDKKVTHILKCIDGNLASRRLLSPAESMNSLTIGALHTDESGDFSFDNRIDLLPNNSIVSLISRVGHGFRRSIKPEILLPGGRQLYSDTPNGSIYKLHEALKAPGQKVATDSSQQGEFSKCVYTRGTSNSTALATRGCARIYEVLAQLQEEHEEQIPDELMAVLIKALLVHGASHNDDAVNVLKESLKNKKNSRHIREVIARYIGYGAVNVDRVLACTAQRATVIGCGEIEENQVHEYFFPLPAGLSGRDDLRRMTVTLAWFSPINPDHRNLREAKLKLYSPTKWGETDLYLSRKDTDDDQVLRGTVQHEVLEGKATISEFEEDGHVLLHVTCNADATTKLDQAIPYGLAVTLEVGENVDIPIYEQIKARIQPQVAVGAPARDR
jgi:hypothetical protein